MGLFVTPEEVDTPVELRGLNAAQAADDAAAGDSSPAWVQALLSPYVQAVHLSLVRQGAHARDDTPAQSLVNLRERLIREGPRAVSARDALRLLWNGDTVSWLHQELWARPNAQLHPSWLNLQAECKDNRLLSAYLVAK